MAIKRFQIVAIALGLLLAASEPGIAAKRTSVSKDAAKSQSRTTRSGGPAIHPYSRAHPYRRDDSDPYAYGVNWPKAD